MNSTFSIPPALSSFWTAVPPAVLSVCRKEPSLFPAVPTLLATRMQLELLLAERSVDLRAAAEVIRNDLGATLEIFRLAGREAGGSAAFTRMEDCLAALPTATWMDAISTEAVERVATNQVRLQELTAFWERARTFAYACWLVAEHTDSVCPEQAYLAGLLREAAHLPALLDWPSLDNSPAQLAVHWQLPELFSLVVTAGKLPSAWRELLDDAHAWVQGKVHHPCCSTP